MEATELKNPIGIKDGKPVLVTEVENGLECGCVCPKCKQPLVAKNNPLNVKELHFSHHNSLSECKGGYETGLHLLAKDIFKEVAEIRLPPYIPDRKTIQRLKKELDEETITLMKEHIYYSFDYSFFSSPIYPFQSNTYKINNYRIESTEYEDVRPDVIISTTDGDMFIEFFVSHSIDDIKREKIINLGITTIEINLSKKDRVTSKDELKKIIFDEIENKIWIYDKKNENIYIDFIKKYNYKIITDELKEMVKKNNIIINNQLEKLLENKREKERQEEEIKKLTQIKDSIQEKEMNLIFHSFIGHTGKVYVKNPMYIFQYMVYENKDAYNNRNIFLAILTSEEAMKDYKEEIDIKNNKII